MNYNFCFVCFPIQTYLTEEKKQHLHSVAAVQLLCIKQNQIQAYNCEFGEATVIWRSVDLFWAKRSKKRNPLLK